jgi:hypothetical protein
VEIENWWKPGAAIAIVVAAGVLHALTTVKLELEPNRIITCPNVPAEINVAWRAPRTDVVNVFIYQIGETPRLWTTGGAEGRAKTGPWIGDGTTLMITDNKGKVLARRTVESVACPV